MGYYKHIPILILAVLEGCVFHLRESQEGKEWEEHLLKLKSTFPLPNILIKLYFKVYMGVG